MFAAAADTIRPRAKTWEEYYDASAFFVSPPLLRPPYDPSEDMLDNAVSTPSTPPQQPTKDDPGSPLSNGPMASLLVVRSTSHEFNISSCYILEESKKLVLRDAEKLLLLHQQLSTVSRTQIRVIVVSDQLTGQSEQHVFNRDEFGLVAYPAQHGQWSGLRIFSIWLPPW